MAIPSRFLEIINLLNAGTKNGALKWSSFLGSSYSTSPWLATKLEGNIIMISAESAGLGLLSERESNIVSVELRILDAKGDELDSVRVRNVPGMLPAEHSDFGLLRSLWDAAKSTEDASQNSRLRAVTESLRARVLSGARPA